MSGPRDHGFYVGYSESTPPAVARALRWMTVLLLVLSAGVAILLATAQDPFDAGTFAYGSPELYTGTLLPGASPRLTVDGEEHALVSEFKHGPPDELRRLVGKRVSLEATPILDPTGRALEVTSVPPEDAGRATELPPATPVGRAELVGEIVDIKCALGAMKPGRGKVHRACATLCIRGGIPPGLLVQSEGGQRRLYWLESEDGGALGLELLHWVGRPVHAEGEVLRRGETFFLRVDPATLCRI